MSGGRTLHFACSCGELAGRLVDVDARDGTHIVCHCDDCRANLVALGHTDPGAEGVELFQTTPDKIKIDQGGENLALLCLSPKGLMRWYAKCCSTPLFNTTSRRGMAFTGVAAGIIQNHEVELGPIISRLCQNTFGQGHAPRPAPDADLHDGPDGQIMDHRNMARNALFR